MLSVFGKEQTLPTDRACRAVACGASVGGLFSDIYIQGGGKNDTAFSLGELEALKSVESPQKLRVWFALSRVLKFSGGDFLVSDQ